MSTESTAVVQIGIVVADAEAAAEHYRTLLGIEGWQIDMVDEEAGIKAFDGQGKPTELRAKVVSAFCGDVEIELIEPQDETSPLAEFLATRGPGVHHVMLSRGEYAKERDRLIDRGLPLQLEGHLPGISFCFFDSEDKLGTVIELAGDN